MVRHAHHERIMSALKLIHLAVRPEPVEGRPEGYETVSRPGRVRLGVAAMVLMVDAPAGPVLDLVEFHPPLSSVSRPQISKNQGSLADKDCRGPEMEVSQGVERSR